MRIAHSEKVWREKGMAPAPQMCSAGPSGTGKKSSKMCSAGLSGTGKKLSKMCSAVPSGTGKKPSKMFSAGPSGSIILVDRGLSGSEQVRASPKTLKNLRKLQKNCEKLQKIFANSPNYLKSPLNTVFISNVAQDTSLLG